MNLKNILHAVGGGALALTIGTSVYLSSREYIGIPVHLRNGPMKMYQVQEGDKLQYCFENEQGVSDRNKKIYMQRIMEDSFNKSTIPWGDEYVSRITPNGQLRTGVWIRLPDVDKGVADCSRPAEHP